MKFLLLFLFIPSVFAQTTSFETVDTDGEKVQLDQSSVVSVYTDYLSSIQKDYKPAWGKRRVLHLVEGTIITLRNDIFIPRGSRVIFFGSKRGKTTFKLVLPNIKSYDQVVSEKTQLIIKKSPGPIRAIRYKFFNNLNNPIKTYNTTYNIQIGNTIGKLIIIDDSGSTNIDISNLPVIFKSIEEPTATYIK